MMSQCEEESLLKSSVASDESIMGGCCDDGI